MRNTGKKDLLIQNIEINGVEYPFVVGSGNNTVADGNEELVWIDTVNSSLQIDDVVKINVTAISEALYDRPYVFNNGTSNFFVKEAPEGEIRINKENSIVIWKDDSTVDLYLEVENVGDSIVILDRFYVNNDTLENTITNEKVQYLSGSSILEPTDKVNVLISNAIIDFDPIRIYNKIGIATPNNIYDELLFTSNKEGFSLSILSEDRIISPEELATLNGHFRKHIPIELNTSFAYIYDDGSMYLQITVKNTGDLIFILNSVYLMETLEKVSFDGGALIDKNEEKVIIVDIADITSVNGVAGYVNEEILVCVTGYFGDTVSSDIGYVHTIREE
ncbi:MAG: hypothetical protein KAT57_13755, partial [Candidatus Lokiarchaeota archaeon]|nr:hypothetical protein [Candidatus Lokiarchaeota archaeon]